MRTTLWWRRVLRWLRGALRGVGASPRAPLEPGRTEFQSALGGGDVNDLRNEAWIAHLRAELPFPQPQFGAAEPPASAKELMDLLAAADVEVGELIARPVEDEGEEPGWFVALAERHLPVAAWYAGVGLTGPAPEAPDRFWELIDRVRRLARLGDNIGQGVERIRERIELLTTANARLSSQNASIVSSYFALLKLHYESILRPLSDAADGVLVEFEFPAPGSRAAELSPLPAPGSPTAGTVGRASPRGDRSSSNDLRRARVRPRRALRAAR
ncbi:MAG: hypothetical protein R3A48_02535 [Polyangiales bacterium]